MSVLQIPALAMEQSPGQEIYAFGVDGKVVPSFAAVSRARRNDDDPALVGYQRPEVNRHIAEIRSYLESDKPMIPNAIVIAFDERVHFESHGVQPDGATRSGVLHIPVVAGAEKAGWIVDGQQRVAAIREAQIPGFPIFAVAFVAQSEAARKEQFMLVNATKPLPKGLIYELLPGMEARLPTALQKRKLPAQLMEILNNDPDSPLYKVVKTATNPGGRMQDNSLLRALENSISDGLLYRIHVETDEEYRIAVMTMILMNFWGAVKEQWADIWELPPRKSRLLHGAGVVSLSFLMDAIADRYRDEGWPDQQRFAAELEKVKTVCRWNEGWWEFGPETTLKWNEVQNVSGHVRMVSHRILRSYQGRR